MRLLVIALLIFICPIGVYALPNGVSYSIEAELLLPQNIIVGTERITFTNRTGEALSELFFHVYPNAFRRDSNSQYQQDLVNIAHLSDLDSIYADPADDAFMEITRVYVDGIELEHSISDTLLKVVLNEPLPDGDSITLEIGFVNDLMETTARDNFAFNRAIRSGHREGVYTIAHWYPRLAVFDESGWHLEPYRFMGEFYGDFGSYDVQIAVPLDFEVGATGELALEILEERKILRFVADNVHDFSWVASPNFIVEEREWEDITIRGLFLHEADAVLLDQVLDAIRYFSSQFGPYAYPSFTAARVTAGGGMEYPAMVMIGGGSLSEVVHEVAHQWWYGAIGNNEYDEAWLDEGFTTFAEERYLIEEAGQFESLTRNSYRFFEPGEVVLQPASAFPSISNYGQAVYEKGSGVLWMLRAYLQPEIFEELLREYYSEFKFQNVAAEEFFQFTSDFVEEDLSWFFEQWLRTTKTLDYVVEDVSVSESTTSTPVHTITIRRDGEAVMPVSIEIWGDDEAEPRIFNWDSAEQRAELRVAGISRISRVRIDPARAVLEQNRSNNSWLPAAAISIFLLIATPFALPPFWWLAGTLRS